MNAREYFLQSSIVAVGILMFTIIAYLCLRIVTSEGFNKLFIKQKISDEPVNLDDDEWEDI
jgi:hypothetical protein